MTEVGLTTSQNVEGKKVILSADYNLLKKRLASSAKVTVDDTTAQVNYDNVDRDAVLKVLKRHPPITSSDAWSPLTRGVLFFPSSHRIAGRSPTRWTTATRWSRPSRSSPAT